MTTPRTLRVLGVRRPVALKITSKTATPICASQLITDFRGFTSTVPSGYLAMATPNLDAGLPVHFPAFTPAITPATALLATVTLRFGRSRGAVSPSQHRLGGYGNPGYTSDQSSRAAILLHHFRLHLQRVRWARARSSATRAKSDGTRRPAVTVTATTLRLGLERDANSNGIYAFVNCLPRQVIRCFRRYGTASQAGRFRRHLRSRTPGDGKPATPRTFGRGDGRLVGVNFTATAIPILSVTPSRGDLAGWRQIQRRARRSSTRC
jgi:hypothetical protein